MNKWPGSKYLLRLDVLLFVLSVLVLTGFSQIDLFFAGLFYDEVHQSFPLASNALLNVPYKIFAYIHAPLLLIFIAGAILGQLSKRLGLRRASLYLLCTLIVAPGLMVNTVLKDNTIGRARPKHVQEFGGEQKFTAAFEYSGACSRNCSFTSGHAAIGFFFLAFAWPLRSRYAFWGGVSLGALLGLMRMAQGAHFFSDVVFSFWVVYGFSFLLAHLFGYTSWAGVANNTKQIEE